MLIFFFRMNILLIQVDIQFRYVKMPCKNVIYMYMYLRYYPRICYYLYMFAVIKFNDYKFAIFLKLT